MRSFGRLRALAAVGCALVAAAAVGGLVVLRAGRPLHYTDGSTTIRADRLAHDPMQRLDVAVPVAEVPGPVRGRVIALPDGRRIYGRVRDDERTDLVVFDPELPDLEPLPLPLVDGPSHDFAPALDAAGDLWFASDRPGGGGGFDIWRARARGDGGFDRPEPVAAPVNSAADEVDPAPDPRGTGLVFVRRYRSLAEGRNGRLMWSDGDAVVPVLDDVEPGADPRYAFLQPTVDRDPAFGPDGVALWFVRQELGGEPRLFVTWRHAGVFTPAVARAHVAGGRPVRGPVPTADGGLELVDSRGARPMLHRAAPRLVHPYWPGQWPLERALWIAFGVALALLALVLLGARWRHADVITWFLLLSALVHLLVWLWLSGVPFLDSSGPGDVGDDRLAIRVVASASGGGSRGLTAAEAPLDARVDRPATRATRSVRSEALDAVAPGTALSDAQRRAQAAPATERPATAVPAVDGNTAAPSMATLADPATATRRADVALAVDALATAAPASEVVATPTAVAPVGTRAAAEVAALDVAVPAAAARLPSAPRVVDGVRGDMVASTSRPEVATPGPVVAAVPATPQLTDAPAVATRDARAAMSTGIDPLGRAAPGALESAPVATSAPRRAGSPADTGDTLAAAPPATGGMLMARRRAKERSAGGSIAPAPAAVAAADLAPPEASLADEFAAEARPATTDATNAPALAAVAEHLDDVEARPAAVAEVERRTGDPGGSPLAFAAPTAPGGSALPRPARRRGSEARPERLVTASSRVESTEPVAALTDAVEIPHPTVARPAPAGSITGALDPRPLVAVAPRLPGPERRDAVRRVAKDPGRSAIADLGSALQPPSTVLPRHVRSRRSAIGVPVARAVTGDLYANRFGPAKSAALERFGGSAATERAVARGLAYLAERQRRSGLWGDLSDRDAKYGEVVVGRSALCVLAFLGAGHVPGGTSEHSAVVERAIDALIARQDAETGHFGRTSSYSHGITTYALAEAFAMTGDRRLRDPVARAVAWIVAQQDDGPDPRSRGGWGYFSPSLRAEDGFARTSVSAWMVMALESAHGAGFDVPESSRRAARTFLAGMFDERRGYYFYNKEPGRLRSSWRTLPASTPAAMFCLLLTGTGRDDPAIEQALPFVLERRPTRYRESSTDAFVRRAAGNVYFWYYGSLACFLAGGDAWSQWNAALKDTLLPAQRDDGAWDPIGAYADYAGDTRRDACYTTAINVLSLEVYYRYFTPLLTPR